MAWWHFAVVLMEWQREKTRNREQLHLLISLATTLDGADFRFMDLSGFHLRKHMNDANLSSADLLWR